MKIMWDEPKRLATIFNHRMDFADLTKPSSRRRSSAQQSEVV
jgi:uncharacterized DUF497 family protein